MLPPKQQLYLELRKIASSIIKEVIEPICKVEGINCDLWMADFDIWTQGDHETNELIITQIVEKYGLTEEQEVYVDSYTSLMQIALFLYLKEQ
jgi:hypothetical protein